MCRGFAEAGLYSNSRWQAQVTLYRTGQFTQLPRHTTVTYATSLAGFMISNHSVPEVNVEGDAQDLNCSGLGGLLTQATHLQTLKLASSYWPEPPDMDDRPPMLQNAKILQGDTRPHLEYLGLRGSLMAGHEDLMDVFDCRQVTLKSVEMIAVRLLRHDDPQHTI